MTCMNNPRREMIGRVIYIRVVVRRFFFPIGRSTGRCDVISAIAPDRPEKTAPDRSEKGHWKMKRPVGNFTFYEGYGTLTP